ncbi:MAG TPA: peptidylprolyl isomerase, partial [Methylibium sp.]|nr:peptidylprolyl isomerase [Methylibium sp.]
MPAVLPRSLFLSCRTALSLLAVLALPAVAQAPAARPPADFIVAVVNQELVTNGEVRQRVAMLKREAAQSGQRLPADELLLKQVLETLIDERAQLTHARDAGLRVDAPELDRIVAGVAAQNRLSLDQLRERLQREGIDYQQFRRTLREQMLLERVREREVQALIKVSDADIDALLASRSSGFAPPQYNIAQVLIGVADTAPETEVAQRRAVAERALARAQAGEDFAKLVAELSGAPKENGGALGLRGADRLPDLFVEAVRDLRSGQVVPQLLRSGAGFHVLKLVERREGGMLVTQTRARHILLRVTPQLSQPAAIARLAGFKQQVEAGQATFAQLAREHSQDGSAAQGGELGWASPGQFVPEFETAMKALAPNQLSEPVVSRFGVHLIQVLERREQSVDRKQQREIARNVLRAE